MQREDGAAFLEFALVAPMLILLIMAILEYSFVQFAESVLEGALQNAAREGSTGYINQSTTGPCPVIPPATSQSQSAYINCLVALRTADLLNPSNIAISAVDYSSYSSAGNINYATCSDNPPPASPSNPSPPPQCVESAQNPGDIVVYTASYPWTIVTPFLQSMLGHNGVVNLQASAIVKNEPYTSR